MTGAAGQLGSTIVKAFEGRWPIVALTRAELDLTRPADVLRAVAGFAPRAIVNTASYNFVDRAESDAEAAFAVNALAVRTLARAAVDADALLVHFSTDFVFDGEADRPYAEDDAPRPRSVYAASKLVGEWFAADVRRHYVLRVESLFGGPGKASSSFDRIVDGIAGGQPLKVFTDRVVSPSYVWDIAAATGSLIEREPAYGLYHCVNSGAQTWESIARDVARRLGVEGRFELVRMADVPLPAARPRYCALSNAKLRAAGIEMPSIASALDRYLAGRQAPPASERS